MPRRPPARAETDHPDALPAAPRPAPRASARSLHRTDGVDGAAQDSATAPVCRPRGRPRKHPVDGGDALARPYHHGALPDALLAAAERVLVRDGIGGLGLRAIAREAGVSHTAPKHHFGDTTGLLSALAAVGFWRLRDAMSEAMAGAPDARGRRNAIGATYVRFAHANPALFGLMFRNEIIDMRNPALRAASTAAMAVMAPTIEGEAELPPGREVRLSAQEAMRVTAAWAYVHGLATLLIDGRLRGILHATDAFGDDPLALVGAVMQEPGVGLIVPVAAGDGDGSAANAPASLEAPPEPPSTDRAPAPSGRGLG